MNIRALEDKLYKLKYKKLEEKQGKLWYSNIIGEFRSKYIKNIIYNSGFDRIVLLNNYMIDLQNEAEQKIGLIKKYQMTIRDADYCPTNINNNIAKNCCVDTILFYIDKVGQFDMIHEELPF